jgi:alkanesulfonate monooxygenase SsuD/methylene tetrahydromethanopterin reductase-like flavin-dependent oxidoreductase (luciferase family)
LTRGRATDGREKERFNFLPGGKIRGMATKRGIFLAPFDELVDPNTLCELASRAEKRGWDGFFLWDHVNYRAPVSAVADPWVALAAIARSTERLRIGPMVTPLSRRRVQKLARETVTLDLLSRGRLTLGRCRALRRGARSAPAR